MSTGEADLGSGDSLEMGGLEDRTLGGFRKHRGMGESESVRKGWATSHAFRGTECTPGTSKLEIEWRLQENFPVRRPSAGIGEGDVKLFLTAWFMLTGGLAVP